MRKGLTRRDFLKVSGGAFAGAYFAQALMNPALAQGRPYPNLEPEDGYDLWLRYRPVQKKHLREEYRRHASEVVVEGDSPILSSAGEELERGLSGLLGGDPSPKKPPKGGGGGRVILGTPQTSETIREEVPEDELRELGPEGYVIRSGRRLGEKGKPGEGERVLIASEGERGVLYGAFHLLRLMQTERKVKDLDVRQRPANPLRIVNHWDNLDRTVERGYAGLSIFHWDELPELDPRYTDYARALASVGINGTVVNNVNASPEFLRSEMIRNLAGLAGALRPWGVTFHLSANYATPLVFGETRDADPFNPEVRAWWREKVDEIYDAIPDFGGFLVKANSEGQPGPLDYGRTHADGANMLAEAVAPHGGIIMWRSFVHEGFSDWAEYQHRVFSPLDGDFAENVAVQTKNGPIDFQVREPVNPLFGAMPNTNQMLELQPTQEYTGHSTHLCYLVPQWKEVLDFDTRAQGEGTTVASIVDGSAYGQTNVGFAGVINWGADRDWTGYQLGAANSHGYARLAWDPSLSAEEIAGEWVRMTFGSSGPLVNDLTDVLLRSWKTYEDYTSPLGVGYMTYPLGAHFDPDPQSTLNLSHYSDGVGTGFDRTVATGTGYTGLYHEYWASRYESLATCPDELLLFMHWVPYTHVLHSGKTVIQHIYDTHFEGLERVFAFRRTWRRLERYVDAQRHADVLATFDDHVEHATLWRDTMVAFFFDFSRILDERRSWVQLSLTGASAVLLGGWPNRVPVSIGNASPEEAEVTAQLQVPEGWTSDPAVEEIPSKEFEEMKLPVMPPPAGALIALDVSVEAGGLTVLGATGREFVVIPAPQLCVLALDAGSSSSPVTQGYTRLAPESDWDPEKGFGWVGGRPQSRDRGGSLDVLRRDFAADVPARTLRIAVPPGRYEAYLLVGDGGPDSYPTFVRSGGQVIAESRHLKGGEFQWLRFELDGGTGGREIDLELDSVPDQYWHLVAFALVDPNAEVSPVIVTDVEVDQPLFGGRANTVNVFVANTTSDQEIPVTARVTTPGGWNADPVTRTLEPGSTATLEVPVTPAIEPAIATLTVEVTAEGREVGDGERSISVISVPPGDEVPLALDSGASSSPVIEGYYRLAPEDAWDSSKGYGWVGATPDFRDRNRLDDLRRDFTLGREQPYTLRLAVPAGRHRVHILTGDAYAPSGNTIVSEGGQKLAESGNSIIPQGSFRWFDFELDGGDAGRTADLELTGALRDGYWRLVALVMMP